MARLPGVADLGPAREAPQTRPVGTYDVTPFARAGQAIAQGVEQLGRGISQAGAGVVDYALDQGRWQYAQAHSAFLTGKADLDEQARADPNPGPDATGKTLSQRYAAGLSTLRDQAAGMIDSGPMRDRFTSDIAPHAELGLTQAQDHERSKQGDIDLARTEEQGKTTMKWAVRATDDGQRQALIDSQNGLYDSLAARGAITRVQAAQMKQAWALQYVIADRLHRAETDPQSVINQLRAAPGSNDDLVERIVHVESDGDPHARARTSSAYGAAQFLESRPGGDQTWAQLMQQHRPDLTQGRSLEQINALRGDPGLSREMLGHLVDQNRSILQHNGVEATPGALYLAHFLGPAGAVAVLQSNPDTPVSDALAKAVGPDMAGKMVAANPTILAGRLAGSVTHWADGKMGGATPGSGSIYDILRPDVREQLLAHAEQQLHRQNVDGAAALKSRLDDTIAESFNTGGVQQPVPLADFVRVYGPQEADRRFADYQANLRLGADANRLADMTPAQQRGLYEQYTPQPGEGYAPAAKRQDELEKAIGRVAQQRRQPADFAAGSLPAARDAWQKLTGALSDKTVSDADRAAAAKEFATKTLMEQTRVDIPSEQQAILPKGYVDHLNGAFSRAATADDPQARMALVANVQREAAMWGNEYWPQVMRQLAPGTQPIVRAIAAGADPGAMTRLLAVDPKKESPAAILRQQNDTKARDLDTELNTAMAPFLGTMVGAQKDRDYSGYLSLARELGALYVRDGKSAGEAAAQAYKDLIGGRYEFRDTWRIPTSAGVAADNVQAGTVAARGQIAGAASAGADAFAIVAFKNDIGVEGSRADSFRAFARDGRFVTAPDNSGLNLVYDTDRRGPVNIQTADGKPLLLTWAELAKLGAGAPRQTPTEASAAGAVP